MSLNGELSKVQLQTALLLLELPLHTVWSCVKDKQNVSAAAPALVWVYKSRPSITFMFHYGLCMTTSICHLILFIIPAVALSDLCLPMAGFNTAECYIMIMSGRGAGMLSASH